MTRRHASLVALATLLALVCCLLIWRGLAGGTARIDALTTPVARLSTMLTGFRQSVHDLPLPAAPMSLEIFGRAYGMRPGSAFAGDFLGGFLGAGLGGLLFGGGFFGGMHSGPAVLGMLAQMLLVYWVSLAIYRRCASTLSPAGTAVYARLAYPTTARLRRMVRPPVFGGRRGFRPIKVNATDLRSFADSLRCLQMAWCTQDMPAVQSLTTTDLAESYLHKLSDLQFHRLRQQISDLEIGHMAVSQAWSDTSGDHARVLFHSTRIEATLDEWDRAVDGSLTEPVTLHEYWRFTRNAHGRWRVCSIERAS